MIENIDRRALAGFRCVDALTNASVLAPLLVTKTILTIRRSSNGIFAVMDAPGVSRSATQQLLPDAAGWPPPANYEITIQDPALRYLPRRVRIQAPQPLPAVLTPQRVPLYPTTAAPVGPNWAVVRAAVSSNTNPPKPLRWAVVQVSGTGIATTTGVSNDLGETLLAVPGLGLTLSASGAGQVTETTTPATVTAWVDPGSLSQPPGWISNPDDILSQPGSTQWKTASQAVQLGPGQTVFVSFTIAM